MIKVGVHTRINNCDSCLEDAELCERECFYGRTTISLDLVGAIAGGTTMSSRDSRGGKPIFVVCKKYG